VFVQIVRCRVVLSCKLFSEWTHSRRRWRRRRWIYRKMMITMIIRRAVTSYLSRHVTPFQSHIITVRPALLPQSIRTQQAPRCVCPSHGRCPSARPASPVLPLTLGSLAINKHQTLPGAAPPIDVILTSELRRRSRRARSPHKFALITGSGYWSEVAERERDGERRGIRSSRPE